MRGWRWRAVRSTKQRSRACWLRQSKPSACAKGVPSIQSRIELGEPSKTYLLRVVVDVDRQPSEVVTVYRSSKVQKYWRVDVRVIYDPETDTLTMIFAENFLWPKAMRRSPVTWLRRAWQSCLSRFSMLPAAWPYHPHRHQVGSPST